MRVSVDSFFDKVTGTVSHVVVEPNGRRCAVVDPVLDYDAASGRTRTDSADAITRHCRDRNLTVDRILETHAHADHLSGARHLKERLGGREGLVGAPSS